MRQLFYKFPVIKQMHALHLQVDEMCRINKEQETQLQELRESYEKQGTKLVEMERDRDGQNEALLHVKCMYEEQGKQLGQLKNKNTQMRQLLLELQEAETESGQIQQMLQKESTEHKKSILKLEKEKITRTVLNQAIAVKNHEIRKQMQYDFFRGLPEEKYKEALCEWYFSRMGRRLNLDDPKTFNEKIQWMKLYDNTQLKTTLTDKVAVREWITEKIGEQYLIPCLGVWDEFEQIDFDTLPDQFVLKANHGSGWNLIVKNKETFCKEDAAKKFRDWLSRNYAWHGLELHYKGIVPKIFAEEYIENTEGDLCDYKFLCFDGKIKYAWIDMQRFTDHRRNIYDSDWNEQDFSIDYPKSLIHIEKPEHFETMKEIAGVLSTGFPLVRVDLYQIDNKIYFGEMTFTCGNGENKFCPEEYDLVLGKQIKLPDKKKFDGKTL